MANYELPLPVPHKRTKANDCWYACIQMLNSWRHKTKTKPTGEHTQHLHSGILGHRLHAESQDPSEGGSKHFTYVLTENKIRCLRSSELQLNNHVKLKSNLQEFGPIMLLGSYGDVGPFAFGHYIVVADVSADGDSYFVHDPSKKNPGWRTRQWVYSKWTNDNESAYVCDI